MKPAPGSTQTDVLTPEQRRHCMSRNKGKDTAPEVALRLKCWRLGLRYKLHPRLTGKPDFVFIREKVAIFVDGCFWHGCPVHYKAPSTRRDFWEQKLFKNRERDAFVKVELEASGWLVLRIWEHDLKNEDAQVSRALEIKGIVFSRRLE